MGILSLRALQEHSDFFFELIERGSQGRTHELSRRCQPTLVLVDSGISLRKTFDCVPFNIDCSSRVRVLSSAVSRITRTQQPRSNKVWNWCILHSCINSGCTPEDTVHTKLATIHRNPPSPIAGPVPLPMSRLKKCGSGTC